MEKSSTDIRIDELPQRSGRFDADVKGRPDKSARRFERFEEKVDAQFAEVDARFEKVDAKFGTVVTKEEFAKANDAVAARLDKIDARFDRWGKIVSGGTVAIAVAVISKVIGV